MIRHSPKFREDLDESESNFDVKLEREEEYKYKKKWETKKSMTICIAAIADYSENKGSESKIVFCSDKLRESVSRGGSSFNGLDYDWEQTKIHKLTDYCIIMNSGEDTEMADEIIQNVKNKIRKHDSKKLSILQITSIIEDEYRAHTDYYQQKRYTREEALTSAELNEIFDAFYAGLRPKKWVGTTKHTNKELKYIRWLSNRIGKAKEYEGTNYFLLFGYNLEDLQAIPQLYIILPTAKSYPKTLSDFATIGAGWAYSDFSLKNYNSKKSISEAILDIYIAKRSSESVDSVGKKTEVGIMKPMLVDGKIKIVIDYLQPNILEKLDELYLARSNKIDEQQNESYKVLESILTDKLPYT